MKKNLKKIKRSLFITLSVFLSFFFLARPANSVVSPSSIMDHHKIKLIKKVLEGEALENEVSTCLDLIKNAQERAASAVKKISSLALRHMEFYLYEDFDIDKLKTKTVQSIKNMEEVIARELTRWQTLSGHRKFIDHIKQIERYKEQIQEIRKDIVTFLCNLYCKHLASKNSLESAKIGYRKAWEKYGLADAEVDERVQRLNLLKAAILLRITINPVKTLSETTDEQIKKIFKKKNKLYQLAAS